MVEFQDPSVMTQSAIFPDANLAAGIPGDVEIFYAISDDTLATTGIYVNAFGEAWVNYFPGQGELFAAAPMSYLDTLNHEIQGTVESQGQTTPIFRTQQLSFQGIGTVITPSDTIIDAIYLKKDILSPDGILSSTVHLILKNSFRNPVFQLTENFNPTTGAVQRTAYWQSDYEDTTSTSTEDENRLQFKVNADATGRVTINADRQVDASIQLINMNGQLVQVNKQLLQRGENTMDFSSIDASGLYILLIIDNENGQYYTQQVAIVK